MNRTNEYSNKSTIWEHIVKQLKIIDYRIETKCKDYIINIFLNNSGYIKNYSSEINTKDEKLLCYYIACMFSDNKDIVEFLINVFDININDRLSQTNFIRIVDDDSIIDKPKLDDGFEFACIYNKNLNVIEYLFEKYNASNFDICRIIGWLLYVCLFGTNFDTICYLLKVWTDNQNNNYLDNFLSNNSIKHNINQIMHLVEDVKIKMTDVLKCLIKSFIMDMSDDIKLYLLKITTCDKIKESNTKLTHYFFCQIQLLLDFISTKDFTKFNLILEKLYTEIKHLKGIKKFNTYPTVYEKYVNFIKNDVNPILLNSNNRKKYGIYDPFSYEFKCFTKLVDKTKCQIDIPKKTLLSKETNDLQLFNHSDYAEILFFHNNTPYRGNRSMIYKEMTFINDIIDYTNFDESFALNIDVPEYCVDMYINAICDKNFNLNDIKATDFYNFISFIDRYPTTVTSINDLEDQIIDYIETNKIEINEYMMNIVMRYKLKNMYLHVHNKKIKVID